MIRAYEIEFILVVILLQNIKWSKYVVSLPFGDVDLKDIIVLQPLLPYSFHLII
jgi:hypothetical protein